MKKIIFCEFSFILYDSQSSSFVSTLKIFCGLQKSNPAREIFVRTPIHMHNGKTGNGKYPLKNNQNKTGKWGKSPHTQPQITNTIVCEFSTARKMIFFSSFLKKKFRIFFFNSYNFQLTSFSF